MSADFGNRPDEEVKHRLTAEKKQEGEGAIGGIKIERNNSAENERNFESHRIVKTHTSSINDDEIKPIQLNNVKRGDSLDFEVSPEQMQLRLLGSLLRENAAGVGRGFEESDHDDLKAYPLG